MFLLACSLFASIASGTDIKKETLMKDVEKAKALLAILDRESK